MKYLTTEDKISIDRLNLLHESIREEAISIYREILKNGISIRITQSLRTFEEQANIYRQGRSLPGNIVTWAKPGYSFHQYGLALDFCLLFLNDKDHVEVSWDKMKDIDGTPGSDWLTVVNAFTVKGWTWGGNFPNNKKDFPHLQKPQGLSITKCIELSKNGKILNFKI